MRWRKPPTAIDWATSMVAIGRARQFKREGKALPEGAAVDAEGVPTTNPDEAVSLLPFGTHKGHGLMLINELVAAFIGGSLPTLRRKPASAGEKSSATFYFQVIHPEAMDAGLFVGGRAQKDNIKALMWRGGCIIRSRFPGNIRDAFEKNPELSNLLMDDFFDAAVREAQGAWRRVVSAATQLGIPMPAIGSALAHYDGYRSERLPANLLQAQRDYFGAQTYERIDKPRGEFFHTNWTGCGGTTASSTYNV
jgi:hypothetical protein